MCEVVLIRHGETDWNRERRFRGRADVPLNQNGLWDVDATAQRIARQWKIAALYSSPVFRAKETAEVIGAATDAIVQIVPDLADIDYGEWQGLTRAEATARHPQVMKEFDDLPSRVHIPGGETFAAVQDRSIRALRLLATRHANDTIAVVAHTEVNRLIILAALGGKIDAIWGLGQETCAINLLRVQRDKIEVLTVNDRCHLDDDHAVQ